MKTISIYFMFLAIVFFPAFVFPDTLSITKTGEWGTAQYRDVFVQGSYAYCAAKQSGIDIIDISSPANPRFVANYDTPGIALEVFVNGNYAYVADGDFGLRIIDISDPSSPSPAGHYQSTVGEIDDVFVVGNYAYTIDTAEGLLVLDVSDPSSPTLVGEYAHPRDGNDSISGGNVGWLVKVFVSGDYAYVVNWMQGMYIIDISTPTSPQLKGEYTVSTSGAYIQGVYVSGNYAYLTDLYGGMKIIDVSNPASPTLRGTHLPNGGQGFWRVYIKGNYAYVSNWAKGLEIVNISNPSNPTLVGSYSNGLWAEGLHVQGNYVYLADGSCGLRVIDASIPASPKQVGNYDRSIQPDTVFVADGLAYISGPGCGLETIDVSNPASPKWNGNYDGSAITQGFYIRGKYAYIANYGHGLQVIDISNPTSPYIAWNSDSNEYSYDVFLNGNYAYVAGNASGLRIFDVSNPVSPSLRGGYNTSGHAHSVYVDGNYAYITMNQTKDCISNIDLRIIDISNSQSPSLTGKIEISSNSYQACVSGNYAYVAGGERGLRIFDVSNPASPTEVGSYQTNGDTKQVFISGNYAYVAGWNEGVQVFDVSDPTNPTLAATYDTNGVVSGVYALGNYIYAVDEELGKLLILKVEDGSNPPQISLNRTSMVFGADRSGVTTGPQSLLISNSGGGTLNWSVSTGQTWLQSSQSFGTNSGEITISVNPADLAAGTYTAVITVSDSYAANSPQTVAVTLTVYGTGLSAGPFGEFATPLDLSTVSSSVPFTGWVLDDIGVQSVQLYRYDSGSLIYIGDAVFVEGARPDIAQAYPNYPDNYKAGWGYMMLTNFLPNGGNGTFTIHAIACDSEGNTTTLGTKTITCDNANAVKPFGAIDTPAQGGTASGSAFRNHGWVLTPMPNKIPEDGSTINVYVDGVLLGNAAYNIYREDIATLFPGYANSDNAAAYFDFDTTNYAQGVHSIYWTAVDDAGNSDGIGSRYFAVQNSGAGRGNSSWLPASWSRPNLSRMSRLPDISKIPLDDFSPVRIKRGYDAQAEAMDIYPGTTTQGDGIILVEIQELERIEIHLGEQQNLVQVFPQPIGSTIDARRGIFYWQPGPGFVGTYPFVFITQSKGETKRREIHIHVGPRQYNR